MGGAISCLALPALSSLGSILVSCFSAAACSLTCQSCNYNNSIATRVGYAIIMLFNSLLAWALLHDWVSKQLENITYGYLKLNCADNSCYGVFGVQRTGFGLALFHFILGALLIVRFFVFYGNYVALIGAGVFILFGLILLVDLAHTWSETCVDKWEQSDSNIWRFILVGSTLVMFLGFLVLTEITYNYFAGKGCGMNTFWITFNLILGIIVTILSILPAIQDANPRSGLTQSSMVVIYCAYLVLSGVANEPDEDTNCNPWNKARGTRTTSVVLDAVFTFLAVAYSTSRAATQSGKATIDNGDYAPLKADSTAQQSDAILAAVERGALPVSALDDIDEEDDTEYDAKDDEKNGCQYNYSFFHIVFALAAMYISMVLTNWNTFEEVDRNGNNLILIDQSRPAVWVKVVSSWICYSLYAFSLLAPVLFPN